MYISFVVPCYNEESCVEVFHEAILDKINKIEYFNKYEIIFVDDGSKDLTLDKIKSLSLKDPSVKFISFARNFGKESAIYAGLKAAKGDIITLIDADLQHPPELLIEMADKIKNKGYDSVYAVRKKRDGENKIKSLLSTWFYKVINLISDTYIEQNSTDYRMMTRQFLNSVLDISEYSRFTKGIFSWVGYKNTYIEYENRERVHGTSKWSLFKLFKYSIEGIVSFSTAPLIFSSILGLFFCFLSVVLILIFLFKTIFFGDSVKGFPTLICSIFLLGGIQLFSIGILGQYLSKVYLEVKNRPIFIAKEKSKDLEN